MASHSRSRASLFSAALGLVGALLLAIALAPSERVAAGGFGPIEVVSITTQCTSSGVTGGITVRNRTGEPVSGQLPLVLTQHIPPSRGGPSHFFSTGATTSVPVSLGANEQATLSYGPLSTSGVDSDANALRVEVNVAVASQYNPEKSDSFPPCAAGVPPTPTRTPTSPPGATVTPTATSTTPPGGATPTSTNTPPGGATPATRTPTSGPPLFATRTPGAPPGVGLPPTGSGSLDGGTSALWMAGAAALAAAGLVLTMGARRPVLAVAQGAVATHPVAAAPQERPTQGHTFIVEVTDVVGFDDFVDVLRALDGLPGVERSQAVHLHGATGTFSITIDAGAASDLERAAHRSLGRDVSLRPR